MTFSEIIAHACQRSRESLSTEIRARRDEGIEVISEPFPRAQSGEVLCAPDGLRLPLRYDLVCRGNDHSCRQQLVDAPTINLYEPAHATWGDDLSIEMRSLTWDYVHISCHGRGAPVDMEPLRSWYLTRVDLADERPEDTDGLHGVVHFLSDPEVSGENMTFAVDFGSASSDALLDLFDVILDMGFTHCILGKTTEEPRQ